MIFFKKISRRGFTLIELVISIFIIGLLSGIFIVNYHGTRKRSALINDIQKMASDINLARTYSTGLKDFNDSIPEGGWGVRLTTASPNSYIIYADLDNDQAYDENEEYKTINLSSGVSIYSINLGSPLDIVFSPPNPIVYINGTNSSAAQITLAEADNNTTKALEVNFFGLIDIIN